MAGFSKLLVIYRASFVSFLSFQRRTSLPMTICCLESADQSQEGSLRTGLPTFFIYCTDKSYPSKYPSTVVIMTNMTKSAKEHNYATLSYIHHLSPVLPCSSVILFIVRHAVLGGLGYQTNDAAPVPKHCANAQ